MKLLKNKKGIDYAMMLALVVFICVVYLLIVLENKLDKFDWRIGQHETGLLNAYQGGEKTMLYVDNAARLSVWQALGILGEVGGMPNQECLDMLGPGSVSYTLWNKQDKDCFMETNFYEGFNQIMNTRLNEYLALQQLRQNNYEFVVLKDKISGFAIEPHLIPVFP